MNSTIKNWIVLGIMSLSLSIYLVSCKSDDKESGGGGDGNSQPSYSPGPSYAPPIGGPVVGGPTNPGVGGFCAPYDVYVAPIMTTCVSCHGVTGTHPNLSTYEALIAPGQFPRHPAAQTALAASIAAMEDGSMPPPNGAQPDPALLNNLKSFQANGLIRSQAECPTPGVGTPGGPGTGAVGVGFGSQADIAYANALWTQLAAGNFTTKVGVLFHGVDPHGSVRETLDYTALKNNSASPVSIPAAIGQAAHSGKVAIKKNYVNFTSQDSLANLQTLQLNPSLKANHLGAYTVMFQREVGYDAANGNIFWAKYDKFGVLMANPQGQKLAGKVGTCIACHQSQCAAGGTPFCFDDTQ